MRPGRGASVFCGCEKRGKDRNEMRLAKGRGSRVIATNIDGPEAKICWKELWYMRNIQLLNRTKSRQSVRDVLFICQMNGELLGVWRSDLLSQVRGSWGLGSLVFQGWEDVNESVGELTAAGREQKVTESMAQDPRKGWWKS